MLYAYVQRFDVMGRKENFWELNEAIVNCKAHSIPPIFAINPNPPSWHCGCLPLSYVKEKESSGP
jgi:NDP-sugar pyrophosphorylase family protein